MSKIKIKNNKSSSKRFKTKPNGKILRKRAYLRHNMRKRNAKNKRVLRSKTFVSSSNVLSVIRLLPNLK